MRGEGVGREREREGWLDVRLGEDEAMIMIGGRRQRESGKRGRRMEGGGRIGLSNPTRPRS